MDDKYGELRAYGSMHITLTNQEKAELRDRIRRDGMTDENRQLAFLSNIKMIFKYSGRLFNRLPKRHWDDAMAEVFTRVYIKLGKYEPDRGYLTTFMGACVPRICSQVMSNYISGVGMKTTNAANNYMQHLGNADPLWFKSDEAAIKAAEKTPVAPKTAVALRYVQTQSVRSLGGNLKGDDDDVVLSIEDRGDRPRMGSVYEEVRVELRRLLLNEKRFTNQFAGRVLVGRMDERILEDIGAELGICKERVRQIEASAIAELRHIILFATEWLAYKPTLEKLLDLREQCDSQYNNFDRFGLTA